MPRAIAAFGVAVLISGCGKVSFGPLDVDGPGMDAGPEIPDVGPEDMGVPPDMGVPDYGIEPGECTVEEPPSYPEALASASWPFAARQPSEKLVVLRRVFYDKAVPHGCNARDCHGSKDEENPLAGKPFIPLTPDVFDQEYERVAAELWERIQMSSIDPLGGPMFAHTQEAGTAEAQQKEIWISGGTFSAKIDFVRELIQSAQTCHTYGWVKKYEPDVCAEGSGGSPDTGTGGAPDAGDGDGGGGAVDMGAQAADCVCRGPWQAAADAVGSSTELMMNCAVPM